MGFLASGGKLKTIHILHSQTWTCEATQVGGMVRKTPELQGMVLKLNSEKYDNEFRYFGST